MEVRDLLARAAALGVKVWAENGQVRFRCNRSSQVEPLLQELSARKAALVEYLQAVPERGEDGSSGPVFRVMAPSLAVPSFRQSTWNKIKSGEVGVESSNGTHRVVRIDAPIDVARLERAVHALVDRNCVLRARIAETDGRPWLRYDSSWPTLEHFDLSGRSSGSRVAEATRLASERIWARFDVKEGPLFRAFLVRLSATDNVCGFVLHHFVADAISMDILGGELWRIYVEDLDQAVERDRARLQYGDYLLGMAEWLRTPAARAHLKYWDDRLTGVRPLLHRPSKAGERHGITQEYFEIDSDLTLRVRDAARRMRTTVFVYLLAAQKAMIARLTGETDITMGGIIPGRELPALAPIVGYLSDRVFYRTALRGDLRFSEVVEAVNATVLESAPYQFVRYDVIKQRQAELSRSILVPFFNFLPRSGSNEPVREEAWAPFRIEPPPTAVLKPHSDWTYWMALREFHAGMGGWLRFNGPPIPGLLANFKHILAQAVEQGERRLSEFSLIASSH
jgi:hypothetical protein